MPTGHFFRAAGCCCVLLLATLHGFAGEKNKLSDNERQQIIHSFLAESPFVHRALPRGKAGVRIEGAKITPSEAELNQIVAQSGAAAKPGDRVRITGVRFERNGVLFEINGGPVKRKSWRERVNVGVNGVDPHATSTQKTDDNVYNDSHGSSVFLNLKENDAITTDQIKDLLSPVLDFKAQTAADAVQKSLPPKIAEAIKKHHALVGMDKQLVLYALGRPPRRVRETRDGKEVEEWIYGTPPQDVEFIRFIDDKAVSIEDMKVSGEKHVRTEDEVGDLGDTLNASAPHPHPQAMADSEDERRSAPTLLRPGEKQESPSDTAPRDRNPNPIPDAIPPSDPGSSPMPPNPAGQMPTGGSTHP
jgi:hypothetical protein